MTTGISILLITVLGWFSHTLNGKYLNTTITHLLYYVGAFIHESSHAIACLLTGAKIVEFSAFSPQPHVTHERSKIPLIGNALISIAPLFGGLFVVYLAIHFIFSGSIELITPEMNVPEIALFPFLFLRQFHFFSWQSWIFLLFLLNIGAMIGPSFQDLKNMWPLILLLSFFHIPTIDTFTQAAFALIVTSIVLQIFLILLQQLFISLVKMKQQ